MRRAPFNNLTVSSPALKANSVSRCLVAAIELREPQLHVIVAPVSDARLDGLTGVLVTFSQRIIRGLPVFAGNRLLPH